MSDPVLVEVVIIFASTGALLLALAVWLLKRRLRAARAPRGLLQAWQSTNLWTPKVVALTVVGAGITLLFIAGVTGLVRYRFRTAVLLLLLGIGLSITFFRHRKIALAVTVLCVLIAMAGPIALVRPTLLGITTTLVSSVLLLVLAIWVAKRYPEMKRADFKKFFDRDPA